MSVFVERDQLNQVVGVYGIPQLGKSLVELPDDHAEVVAFRLQNTRAGMTCTALQARRALRAAGLFAVVEAMVEAHESDDVRDAFHYAAIWHRTDPWIEALAPTLNLDAAALDALFAQAALL